MPNTEICEAQDPVRPLSGVRVIELANYISGPTVGMFLADYGAEVIKVEHPSGGDAIRTWGAQKNGVSLFHKVLNRNKRSITADLKTEIGVEIVRKLARTADVVLENFRPGTLEEWGLGYEVSRRRQPWPGDGAGVRLRPERSLSHALGFRLAC